MRKKKLIISLSVILAIIIALTVTLCIMFIPRKLSGIVPTKGIKKIELTDAVFNQETEEEKNVTYLLEESKHEDFIKEVRNTKYKNKYIPCKCICLYEYVVYYDNETEIHFNELNYYKKANGEIVKSKYIDLESAGFYKLFLS